MSLPDGLSPPRVCAASVAAAGAAATPTILLGPIAIIALPVGFVIAGIHVLLFGLPAYYLLRRRMQVDWAQAMIAGFIIGAVPLMVWSRVVDPTPRDLDFLWFGLAGVLGMLGGMTFRAIIGPAVRRTCERETAAIFK